MSTTDHTGAALRVLLLALPGSATDKLRALHTLGDELLDELAPAAAPGVEVSRGYGDDPQHVTHIAYGDVELTEVADGWLVKLGSARVRLRTARGAQILATVEGA